jgi:hypothetical protein
MHGSQRAIKARCPVALSSISLRPAVDACLGGALRPSRRANDDGRSAYGSAKARPPRVIRAVRIRTYRQRGKTEHRAGGDSDEGRPRKAFLRRADQLVVDSMSAHVRARGRVRGPRPRTVAPSVFRVSPGGRAALRHLTANLNRRHPRSSPGRTVPSSRR